MYNLARQLLFKLSPETSHDLSLDLIGAGGRLGLNGLLTKAPARLPVTVMGRLCGGLGALRLPSTMQVTRAAKPAVM